MTLFGNEIDSAVALDGGGCVDVPFVFDRIGEEIAVGFKFGLERF